MSSTNRGGRDLIVAVVITLACAHTAIPDPLQCTSGSTSGYLYPRAPQDNSGIFHWLFPSKRSPQTDATVVWLQGGPGASSLLGCFYEHGPCLVQKDGTLTPNADSWNRQANLIYIDQPVGTGFSYAASNRSLVSDEETMAADMVQTLVLLIEKYPHLQNNPLVLAGESYAGRYIPYVATAVTAHNQKGTKPQIPLTTLFLNDPWTNPAKIVSTYANFSLAHGLISPGDVLLLNANMTRFTEAMAAQRYDDATDIEHAMEHYIEDVSGVNAYDIRRYGDYDYSGLEKLLTPLSVRQWLGVGNHTWTLSSKIVNEHLHADISRATSNLVGPLLERYRVVIYNGNYDLDCNIWGTLKWLVDVKWSGATEFAKAATGPGTSGERRKWYQNSTSGEEVVAGYCVEVDRFTQLVMLNAGHMVPQDQRAAALALLLQTLASPLGGNPACRH